MAFRLEDASIRSRRNVGKYNGRLETAYEIMDMAARCGANAIKLQTYTADTIRQISNLDFMISGGLWDGMSLYSYMIVRAYHGSGTKKF